MWGSKREQARGTGLTPRPKHRGRSAAGCAAMLLVSSVLISSLSGPSTRTAGALAAELAGGSASPTASAAKSVASAAPSAALGAQGTTFSGTWTNVSSGYGHGPPPSWDWATAYDPTIRSVVLFGGCPYSIGAICYNQTWTFNASSGWVEWNNGSRPGPSARQGPMMAYDPAVGAVVLFGGDRLGAQMSDTWEWKNGTWSKLTTRPGKTPHGRYDGEMAWDPAVKALVLFGGSWCILTGCKDTWEFRTKWVPIPTASDPPGRAYFGLVFDPSVGALLLSSGQAYNGHWYGQADTWEFNGTNWVQLHPRHSPPPEQQAIMAYDSATGYLLYVPTGTGATWIYRGGDWVNVTSDLSLSPSPRALPALQMDPAIGEVLLFGGAAGVPRDGQASGSSPTLNDTWVWR